MSPLLLVSVLFLLFSPVPLYAITFQELPLQLQFVSIRESGAKQYRENGRLVIGPFGEIGFLQIHPIHFKEAKKLGYDIYDPNDNMAFGLLLYKKEGLKPWSASLKCYKKLSYSSFVRGAL